MRRRKEDPVVVRENGVDVVVMGDWRRKILPNHSSVEAKLASMDEAGIAMTALSVNDPGPEWFGGQAADVARLMNDYIAGFCREHPARFFGLCVLPLSDIEASQTELDRCAGELPMKGILLYTNLKGKFPDEPEFRPILSKAAKLGMPVLLHPAYPLTTPIVKGYEMTSSLGNMFENTVALTRIIMAGILDELPDLKLVCPHLGGTLPYIIGRLDHQTQVLKRGPKYLRKPPSEYLKQVYFDVVSPLPLAMKFALEMMGPDRLLFASDHPWVEPRLIAGHLESLSLPPGDARKIFTDNARRLFSLPG